MRSSVRVPASSSSLVTFRRALRAAAMRASAGAAGVTITVCGGAALAEDSTRIVGGQPESRHPGVGALLVDGDWFCSGTAIAPRVVLTAAHCVEDMDAGAIEFFVGPNANQLGNGRRIQASAVVAHPNHRTDDNYDVGVVLLESDVGVATIPARLDPISANIVGKEALFVGYGLTVQNGDGGEKRSVEMAITEVNDFFVGYATPAMNTCNGDSGGPALMDLGRGLEVIGVTSYGDAACEEYGYNTRSDVFASWIRGYLDGTAPTASNPPVGGETGDDAWTDDGGDDWSDDGGSDGDDWSDFGDGDICAELGWYDDGMCDSDCAEPDPDCDGAGEDSGDDGAWDDTSDDVGDDGWDDLGDDETGDDTWSDDDTVGDDAPTHDAPTNDGEPAADARPSGGTAPPFSTDGTGCSGGTAPLGLASALAGLAFVATRRRRV